MIIRRLLIAIPLLLLVSFLVYALTAAPGADPARAILGEGATPASVAALHKSLGLDEPLLVQYGHWLKNVFSGSLGQSWYGNIPVTTKIAQGVPVTAALVLSSLVVTAVVALPLGLRAGMHAGGRFDRVASAVAGFFLAMPEFWVALLLILLLSQKLHLLPGTGSSQISGNPLDNIRHFALPVIALSLPQICSLFRLTRSSAASVVGQDYIRTARAGGISESRLLWTRISKNALVPSVTLLGLQLGRMIGVAAVVESVYGIQGLGLIAVQAALSSDIPIVLGVVLVTAAVVMLANLLADVATYSLSPKARRS